MNRHTSGASAVLLLLLIVAVLAWGDVRLARSTTQAEHTLTKYTLGVENERDQPSHLRVYVAGNDTRARTIQNNLVNWLRDEAGVGTVNGIDTLDMPSEHAILMVEVMESRMHIWTPVFARGQFSVRVTYTSNGDLAWRHESPVVMQDPAVWADGDFQVRDTTWGMTTWPAYQRHIGQQIAAEVQRALEGQVLRLQAQF